MLALKTTNLRNVLCLGAHPDDLEIGCGGTMLKLVLDNPRLQIRWVVFSGNAARRPEARQGAQSVLGRLPRGAFQVKNFRESFFPSQWAAIKSVFESLKKGLDPDLILTHSRDDRHQDHRVLSDLTWNTFRDHLILEYEVPKYDGDLGQPNVFVPLEKEICDRKKRLILDCFTSQRSRHWFTEDTFHAMLRLRGIECASPTGYAEAFYGRKVKLDLAELSRSSKSAKQKAENEFTG